MAQYGSFETVRTIGSGAGATVSVARKGAHGANEFALKVFSLEPAFGAELTGDGGLSQLETDFSAAFAARVELQQRAGAASPFVAPIFESGQETHTAWYATKFYPRSLAKIIEGKVALSGDAMFHVVRSVVKGALAFKQNTGRAHGNLKPANVLIGAGDKLQDAAVAVSDPLAGGAADAAAIEFEDLRGVGRLVLQMVKRRMLTEGDNWMILPVLVSPEWTQVFGKTTDGWLTLSNRLLDPNLSPGDYTLDQLDADLAALAPKPPVSKGLFIGLGVAVVILGVGGFFAMRHFGRSTLVVSTSPPGAKVFVGGQAVGETTTAAPEFKQVFPKGELEIRVEHPRLGTQSRKVSLPGAKTVSESFTFQYGRWEIASQPPGATVEIDGGVKVATPHTSDVMLPTNLTLRVTLDKHQSTNLSVLVPSNGTTAKLSVALVAIREGAGIVEAEGSPPGAKFFIRSGGELKPLDRANSLQEVGTYDIVAQLDGWPDQTNRVPLTSGQTTSARFYFPHGVVRLEADPRSAEFRVGGKPIRIVSGAAYLKPGSYEIDVEAAGYYPTKLPKLDVAERTTNRVALVQLKPRVGFVDFTFDPPGAKVFDLADPNQPVPLNGSGRAEFKPGTYSIAVRVDGLDEIRTNLTVAVASTQAMTIRFAYGTANVEITPAESKLFVGTSERTGESGKFTIRAKPGTALTLTGKLAYHYDFPVAPITLGDKQTTNILIGLKRLVLPVLLASDPAGAQFAYKETGLALRRDSNNTNAFLVTWGAHELVARFTARPGLPEFTATKSIEVHPEKGASALFQFDYGTVDLAAEQPDGAVNANILLNGQAVGRTPAQLPLKPGTYQFGFEYDGYVTNAGPFNVASRGKLPLFTIKIPVLKKFYTNSLGMEFSWVGSIKAWVGKHEVTESQYLALIAGTPEAGPNRPIVGVGLPNAQDFCARLSALDKEKNSLAARKGLTGATYAVPTKDQWESIFKEVNPNLKIDTANDSAGAIRDIATKERADPNKFDIQDLGGGVSEIVLGPGNAAKALGANFNLRKTPANINFDRNVPYTDQEKGSRDIGFRCLLLEAGR